MPVYEYWCQCGKEIERIQPWNPECPECPDCHKPMNRKAGSVASFRIKGLGYNSRRKWMDNWTPESPAFSTGSLHGEKY
jgi:putative FmdB family regulatory protein